MPRVVSQNNTWIKVSFSENELDDFKRRWPCNNIPDKVRSAWFEFDKRNGDLVDYGPRTLHALSATGHDNGAVLALSHDAWRYAEGKARY